MQRSELMMMRMARLGVAALRALAQDGGCVRVSGPGHHNMMVAIKELNTTKQKITEMNRRNHSRERGTGAGEKVLLVDRVIENVDGRVGALLTPAELVGRDWRQMA